MTFPDGEKNSDLGGKVVNNLCLFSLRYSRQTLSTDGPKNSVARIREDIILLELNQE